mmetsp:Transcript_13748/g.15437  ORF Transcript_13748/g.15437 Transcript_13748/m.15437 type:complete len:127 (+) Transcript_13748:287-667(+)
MKQFLCFVVLYVCSSVKKVMIHSFLTIHHTNYRNYSSPPSLSMSRLRPYGMSWPKSASIVRIVPSSNGVGDSVAVVGASVSATVGTSVSAAVGASVGGVSVGVPVSSSVGGSVGPPVGDPVSTCSI